MHGRRFISVYSMWLLCCRTRLLLVGLAIICSSAIAFSEDASEPELTPEQRAAHLARMRTIAQSIKINEINGDRQLPVDLAVEPVLRYTDHTRKQHDSTVWIWGTKGRPSAIMAIEYYPTRPVDSQWLFEVVSLSTGRISAEHGKELQWTARQAGLRFQPLADSPAPKETAAARLSQMKQLQTRFGAYERTATEGRIELRPMARPLHRYRDETAGVLDGAIFAFANGTNPEIGCILEARMKGSAAPSWEYALIQMTGAEVYAELDSKELWSQGEADPPADRDNFVNGWLAISNQKSSPK